MCDSGSDIRSLQFIDASGCKRFLGGNLEPVARALRNKFSDVQLIVLDWSLPG